MTTATFTGFLPVVRPKTYPPRPLLRSFCPWPGQAHTPHGHFCGVFARGQAKNIPTTGTFAVFLPLVCILEHTAGHCIEVTNEYQVCAEHYCCCSKRTRSLGVPKKLPVLCGGSTNSNSGAHLLPVWNI